MGFTSQIDRGMSKAQRLSPPPPSIPTPHPLFLKTFRILDETGSIYGESYPPEDERKASTAADTHTTHNISPSIVTLEKNKSEIDFKKGRSVVPPETNSFELKRGATALRQSPFKAAKISTSEVSLEI